MAKTKSQKTKAVRVGGGPARSGANGPTVTRLRAENKRLRESLRKVEKERDTYLRTVYAWVEEEVAKQDLGVLLNRKGAVPFSQVIEEMKQELER